MKPDPCFSKGDFSFFFSFLEKGIFIPAHLWSSLLGSRCNSSPPPAPLAQKFSLNWGVQSLQHYSHGESLIIYKQAGLFGFRSAKKFGCPGNKSSAVVHQWSRELLQFLGQDFHLSQHLHPNSSSTKGGGCYSFSSWKDFSLATGISCLASHNDGSPSGMWFRCCGGILN